jgi:CyaY protein
MQISEESDFRRMIQLTLDRVARALDAVDPDLAEYEMKPGQLTIVFANKSKCILSTQPSVRQLWLAIAAKGTAFHFNLSGSEATGWKWVDDKGKGIELLAFLASYLREEIGSDFPSSL